jgi:hypothetical protein
LSQIAFVDILQSADSTHSTQPPLAVSQLGVASKRSQSADVVQPSQTSVVMLHTGCSAPQPVVEHFGTSHS